MTAPQRADGPDTGLRRGHRDVVVASGRTVGDALDAAPARWWFDGTRLVLVADEVDPGQARRAVALGVRVILRRDRATPWRLADAVCTARDGLGRVPADVLPGTAPGPAPRPAAAATLTARQTEILALMAEGRSNGEIADGLGCSPHTVRHAVHELMGRLVVRTRAQAVAHAVRAGLV